MLRTLHLIRIAIVLLPVLVLGFWGFSYLRMAFSTLLAPGVPVSLALATPGGALQLKASSYAINLRAGRVLLEKPEVYGPDGKLIFACNRIDVAGLNVVAIQKSELKIRVADAYALVVRSKTGQFAVTSYFPQSSSSQGGIVFQADITRLNGEFLDNYGSKPFTQKVEVFDIKAAGLGGDWLGNGRFRADIGSGDLSLRKLSSRGLEVSLDTSGLELSRLAKHILETPQGKIAGKFRDISIGSVVAKGPVEVLVPGNKSFDVQANLDVAATNIRWDSYRLDKASFKGIATKNGFSGSALAYQGPNIVNFTGSGTWLTGAKDPQIKIGGNVDAKVKDLQTLPSYVVNKIPKGVSAKGIDFKGNVSFTGPQSVTGSGEITLDRAGFNGHYVTNIVAEAEANQQTVWTHLLAGRYENSPLRGQASIDLKQMSVQGALDAKNIDILPLLSAVPAYSSAKFGTPSGKANAYVLVTGPLKKPVAELRVLASGSYLFPKKDGHLDVERIGLLAHYENNTVEIRRLSVRTSGGNALALGKIDLKTNEISGQLDMRGFDIASLHQGASGYASVAGNIDGSLGFPKLHGRLEGYDLTYQNQTLALAAADFNASRRLIDLTGIEVVRGISQVTGALALHVKDQTLSGNLQSKGIQIGDFLGEDYIGTVDLHTTRLSGTLSKPQLRASLTGDDLLADGIPVSKFLASVSLDGQTVVVEKISAAAVGGTVAGSGSYNIKEKKGQIVASVEHVDLAKVLPQFQKEQRTSLAGLVSGTGTVGLVDNKLGHVTIKGTLASMALNGVDLGGGVWSAEGNGVQFTGSAQTGSGTKFLALENGTYNLDTKAIGGEALSSNIPIKDIYDTAFPYLPLTDTDVLNTLAGANGLFEASVDISGSIDDPSVSVPKLTATDLTLNGIAFGNLSASGSKVGDLWKLDALSYVDGPTILEAHGTVKQGGETNLEGELDNLDLAKINKAYPPIPAVAGTASTTFVATGPSSSPKIRASLNAVGLGLLSSEVNFGVDFDTIEITDGKIDASGNLNYKGFVGQLTAEVPLTYPFKLEKDQPLSGQLVLSERPLSDISPFFEQIDPVKSQGTVKGKVVLSGTFSDPHLDGNVAIQASTLALRTADPTSTPKAPKYLPVSTELQNFNVTAAVTTKEATITSSGTSNFGGGFAASLSAPLTTLLSQLEKSNVPTVDALEQTPLTGQLKLLDFSAQERNKTINFKGIASGTITVSGAAMTPAIAGQLAITNLQSDIPAFGGATSAGSKPVFNPSFNLGVSLADTSVIKNTLATIQLGGDTKLTGSLENPNALANLHLVKGQLQLPGSRVRLEPGGTIQGTYAVNTLGAGEAHLNVDLLGNARVTSVGNTDVGGEVYDISLEVQGDLLNPDQVRFIASSDPPDLSQDQILVLLGRTDLLTALGSSSYAQSENRFKGAAISYALPNVLDPLTSRLASGLQLDYISVDYNALNQTSLSLGKTLGDGFSITARRQLSEPTPGYPLSYDYRLTYRLPYRNRLLHRVSFFLGQDEIRPIKLGVEYQIRF